MKENEMSWTGPKPITIYPVIWMNWINSFNEGSSPMNQFHSISLIPIDLWVERTKWNEVSLLFVSFIHEWWKANERQWNEVKATPPQAAKRCAVSQANQPTNRSLWRRIGGCWRGESWFVEFGFLFLWRVMGGATRQCSAKKKDKRKQTNSTTLYLFFIHLVVLRQFGLILFLTNRFETYNPLPSLYTQSLVSIDKK